MNILIFFILLLSNFFYAQEKRLVKVSKDTVSLLYYPAQEALPLGHMEVEAQGRVKSISCCMSEKKNLNKKIKQAEQGGFPFFRIKFDVSKNEAQEIRELLRAKQCGFICASSALVSLEKKGICYVPPPVKYSPLLVSAYLKLSQKLGANNVQEIKFYGSKDRLNNTYKIMNGVICECVVISFFIFCMVNCLR